MQGSTHRRLEALRGGAVRLIPLVLTIVLCLAFKENFPFSHFPMYKSFGDHTYYVFVADADGEPIPVQSITHVRTSRLKKIYDGQLREIQKNVDSRKRDLTPEQRRPAAEETLRWLYANTREEARPILDRSRVLRLYHADITLEDGAILQHDPELVGEFPVPPTAAATATFTP